MTTEACSHLTWFVWVCVLLLHWKLDGAICAMDVIDWNTSFLQQANNCYRNWYQYWGHCCLSNGLGSSPQPGRWRSPRAVVSSRLLIRQQCPKLKYQFLFYHDETKLMMNKRILTIYMVKIVPQTVLKLSLGYSMVTCVHRGVRWPDCQFLVTNVATTEMSQYLFSKFQLYT